MLKRWAIPLLIILLSLLASLTLLEVWLRQRVAQPELVPLQNPFRVDSHTRYFKTLFLTLHLSPPMLLERYDAELGWDDHIATGRVRGRTLPTDFQFAPTSHHRVITIGDSFTYGSDVSSEESYPAQLEQLLQADAPSELLNMGVPGYGIDQAALKHLRHGQAYQPNWVVFGIHTPNYVRTGLPFFSYAKPYFLPDANGRVQRVNGPIPPPAKVLEQVKQELSPARLYLLPYLDNAFWRLASKLSSAVTEPYYRQTDQVVGHFLDQVARALPEGRLLIVLIPGGEVFQDEASQQKERNDPNYRHLLALITARRLPVVDLYHALPDRFGLTNTRDSFYLRRDRGQFGHFTAAGNRAVATLLHEAMTHRPASSYKTD